MVSEHHLSERRACRLVGLSRDSYRHPPETDPMTQDLAGKIVEIVNPKSLSWKGEVKIIFQTLGGLHKAIGSECGDWYFSGDYPTPGGYEMVNRAFVHFYEGKGGRAYGESLF